MIPFSAFEDFPPTHRIWKDVMFEYYNSHVVDLCYYSRLPEEAYIESLSKEGRVTVDEKPAGKKPDFSTAEIADRYVIKSAERELFPTVAIRDFKKDPLNIRNEHSPVYGSDAFIPFCISVSPISSFSEKEFVFAK
jgi:hypothetical protein